MENYLIAKDLITDIHMHVIPGVDDGARSMEESCEIGAHYELYGCVSDKIGNSLTFCVPFTGYNFFVPKLIMSELQIN